MILNIFADEDDLIGDVDLVIMDKTGLSGSAFGIYIDVDEFYLMDPDSVYIQLENGDRIEEVEFEDIEYLKGFTEESNWTAKRYIKVSL